MEFSDEEIISLALENNEEAKNIIYEKNKFIVDNLLHKYYQVATKLGIDMKELEQEAYLSFSDALNSYREDKNTKLSTFIFLCVERRLQKIIRRSNGEKAKLLNNTYSLDYDYNEDGTTLKDLISDSEQSDPLNNLASEEGYKELLRKIKSCLSESEYEVFNYVIRDFDYQTIAILINKNPKQVDNTIQRIKHKIRDIMKSE